ncbi:MAG: GDSL-type esterase/lipase family protein [Desulfobulbaceae bacterium]|nr:GDSL-type esterase/lipase family protein [Desulfobulbaceae bacterium]
MIVRFTSICHYHAVLFALLSVLITAVGVSAVERDKAIIAFGDSITQGYPEVVQPPLGARVGGYEPDLEALTDSRKEHYNVYNYGRGGETTLEGMMRFDYVLSQHPMARYVLLLEGTNDIWSQISREDTVYYLSVMIDMALDFGIEPVIGTITPDPRPVAADKNIPLLNQMIRDMAADRNVVVADLYAEMVDDWESTYIDILYPDVPVWNDWLHPNRAGYEKMAEIWFKAVFHCSLEYLDQCKTDSECTNAGAYWYKDVCNPYPPPFSWQLLLNKR